MERISLFKTLDGKTFSTPEEALEYESIMREVQDFLLAFAENEDLAFAENEDIDFSNGDGYIQHPSGTRDKMEKKLVELSNRWLKPDEPFTAFTYYLGRVIDDNQIKCLYHLSYRVMCIDNEDKEWGQPYYALNKGTGKDKKLN